MKVTVLASCILIHLSIASLETNDISELLDRDTLVCGPGTPGTPGTSGSPGSPGVAGIPGVAGTPGISGGCSRSHPDTATSTDSGLATYSSGLSGVISNGTNVPFTSPTRTSTGSGNPVASSTSAAREPVRSKHVVAAMALLAVSIWMWL